MKKVILLMLLLILALVVAIPVGATPPEPLTFTFTDVTYYNLPTQTGYGTWRAEGLFSGEGDLMQDPNHSGWDPEGCWRTVHTEDTLMGPTANDKITIRTQITKIEGAPNCFSFNAKVNWVITSAEGIYEGLHGQGKGNADGHLEFDDEKLNYVITFKLSDGNGHFE